MQLNLEQKRIIQLRPGGHTLLKGVAGSGKTTVAVHRIPFLLNHYCFAKDDSILMVTYNKTLVNYIKYLYEKVDDEDKDDYRSIFSSSEENRVYIETMDSIMYKYYIAYKKENKFKYSVIENKDKYPIISECVSELSKIYKNINILDQKYVYFLLDEIDWIKSCKYLELEEYQNADRIGRTMSQNTDGPQKLMKNSDTRKSIYELMTLYNKKLNEKGLIDFKDMDIFAYKQAKIKPEKKYTHIIIDESQDLTRVQLEFLKLLLLQKEYSSLMFICDTAQSIYSHSWLVKGRSFTSIGFDMTGKSNSLSKNYRTTAQIAEAAYSLIEHDNNIVGDENFVKPSLIDHQGAYPIYRWFKSNEDEAGFIVSEIKNNLLNKFSKKDIVVIAKKKNQLKYVKECMDKEGLPNVLITKCEDDFDGDNIKLITMHSIKGLEFKVVIIAGLNKDVIPFTSYQDLQDEGMQESSDRKLLYVGMTRANEILYMTSGGNPSKFIGEIDSRLLKLDSKCRMRRYYNVGIDDYEYKKDIIDVYSNEEKVRQWVIKELIGNYKYTRSLIAVEYKVNNFSKIGSVDIVLSIYRNGTKIPYVFIETKAYGQGCEAALRQIQSYMSNCKTCQYGLVTDGNEVVVINKKFEVIDDIPLFNPAMLPSSIECYNYIDFKFNYEYKIERDKENEKEITLISGDDKKIVKDIDIVRIPVYSNIAAGEPIYINDELKGQFPIPYEILKGKENCFILKIRGDSMIGANIENGDYVVIQKQETALNRDIVAVAIDNDATLKRFMKMGDTVLLISENEKYEPIQLKDDQVKIIGIAIGTIRKFGGN